LSLKEEWLIGD